jgi:hypothetical protein
MKKRIGAKNLKIGEQDEQGGCWYRLRVIVAFKKKARDTHSSDWEVHYIETRAHTGEEAVAKVRRLFAQNHWVRDDTKWEIVDADDRHFLA